MSMVIFKGLSTVHGIFQNSVRCINWISFIKICKHFVQNSVASFGRFVM